MQENVLRDVRRDGRLARPEQREAVEGPAMAPVQRCKGGRVAAGGAIVGADEIQGTDTPLVNVSADGRVLPGASPGATTVVLRG